MLQAGKQLECLINEQVRLPFWFDLTLLAHMFLAKHRGQYKLMYVCTTSMYYKSLHCWSQDIDQKHQPNQVS